MRIVNKVREAIHKKVIDIRKRRKESEEKQKKEESDEIDFDALVDKNVNELNIENKEERDKIKERWKIILKNNAKKYGKISEGNKIKIYNEGTLAFRDILNSINKGKKRVWLESYIFDDSKLAEEVVNSLCKASKRGCDVILLIDYIGSLKMKNKWVQELKEYGVHVIFFNTFLNSFFNMLPIFFRDHRKILIVDNTAYCGSMNVAENVFPSEVIYDYEEGDEKEEDTREDSDDILKKKKCNDKNEEGNNKNEEGNNKNMINNFNNDVNKSVIYDDVNKDINKKKKCLEYYDLHIKIKGPAVKDLADVFIDSLKMSKSLISRESIEDQKKYQDENSCYVQVLESNVLRKIRSIQSTFDYIIRNGATNNIYITTSYFLPPGFLRRALFSALYKGVNISFLFSGNSDVFGDVPATYYMMKKILKRIDMKKKALLEYNNIISNYINLHKSFIRYPIIFDKYYNNYEKKKKKERKNKGSMNFYFFQKKHCHAKNLVVDNLWCSIGSYNWDRFSSRRNLEVMISIFDKKICDQFIKEHQNKVINDSIQITLSQLINRNFFQIFMSYCAYHLGKLSGRNIFDGLSNNSKKTILRKAIISKYLNDNCIQNISLNMMWGV
ncbi:mitochondrial cardiolipin synthase, putative [Plasmodium sp. gorilla clade G2]|uniref:mitochondrial cardiolipin synthase, putative n=1 Tax=Plasmodium sp. gorilla clade G2 TaxID=880535 RepID=UPI000D212E31|nr:mitochondrial cardiolipin synthase, putative [Plasmodium sp. gorilla clade G2]SOV12470.1 mitochondrial cardiolipin synthase, putative [Plasmodium sp. gorilla clade G2]